MPARAPPSAMCYPDSRPGWLAQIAEWR